MTNLGKKSENFPKKVENFEKNAIGKFEDKNPTNLEKIRKR